MSDKALAILSDFVDKLEQQPDRTRRVTAKPPPFDNLAEREAFEAVIKEAVNLGAVDIEYGKRGASHLMQRIVLKDHAHLYGMLGRTPLEERVSAASTVMQAAFPDPSPELATVMNDIAAGWAARRQPYGFTVDDRSVVDFLRALDAVLRRLRRDPIDKRDLRTFSRKTTGDSKLIERYRSAIASYLRQTDFPSTMSDGEVFAAMGLEKFPQPVLIAGPIAVGESYFGYLPYVGLPPEAIDLIKPVGEIRSVLSIENLASFNRHVREARHEGDVVIYTGGFPSRATRLALRTAFSWRPSRCFHWGDIDPSGIEIAYYIARATGTNLRPHLMTPDIARSHGTAASPTARLDADNSAFAELAMFLASDDACHLEQEALDPQSVRC